MATSILVTVVMVFAILVASVQADSERPYNILFVLVDDLQPVLGVYGNEVAQTPNIDALLNRGIRFENMNAQKSECAPSRISMITGKRNDAIKSWAFLGDFRTNNPYLHTWPGWLRKDSGYKTVGVGKVVDTRSFFSETGGEDSDEINFPDLCESSADKFCSFDEYYPPALMRSQTRSDNPCEKYVLRWPADPPNETYEADKTTFLEYAFDTSVQDRHLDYCIRKVGVEKLKELANDTSTPWFLSVGFVQPHMPWVARHEDFDIYRTVPDSLLNPDPLVADSVGWWTDKTYSFRNNTELEKYGNQDDLDDSDRVRGYYAGTHFIDTQVGELMSVFDSDEISEEVRNNTMILFWGDHGFHLGDHGLFGKKTVYEHATRVPAGFIPPPAWVALDSSRQNNIGSYTSCPLDTVDFYPTVLDILGSTLPPAVGSSARLVLAGTSLTELFSDRDACPRSVSISQYEKDGSNMSGSKVTMGYSLRSKCYRFIVYMTLNMKADEPLPSVSTMSDEELYRYAEPGVWEYDDDIDDTDSDSVNAESKLTAIASAVTDGDWTHVIGSLPFDMNEC